MKKLLIIILILLLGGVTWLSYSQSQQIKNLESKIEDIQKADVKTDTQTETEYDFYETEEYSFSIPKGYKQVSGYLDYNGITFGPPEVAEALRKQGDVGGGYTPHLFIDNSEKNISFYNSPAKYDNMSIGEYDVELWEEMDRDPENNYHPFCQYRYRILGR